MYSLRHLSANTFASHSVSKTSTYPFSQGLPGSMYNVFTPTALSQSLTVSAVNSDPLSDRTYSGTPRSTNNSANRSNTSG